MTTSQPKFLLPFLTGMFTTIILSSNFMAMKLIDVGSFTVPAAVVCYPLSFVCGDIITELFGFKTTRKAVFSIFIFNAIIVCFLSVASIMPPSAHYNDNEAFRTVFLSTPWRILGGSFVAFIICGILNSFVFDALKKTGKFPLMARSSISTAISIIFDSIIFIGIAFGGTLPLQVLWITMVGQILAKFFVGILIGVPLTWCILRSFIRLKFRS